MEPVNKGFLCWLLHVNSTGGIRERRHIAFPPPPTPAAAAEGAGEGSLPRASEDSGMSVLSHLFPAGFQGAGLHEVNARPDSQFQGPLFLALQPSLVSRMWPGGEGEGSPEWGRGSVGAEPGCLGADVEFGPTLTWAPFPALLPSVGTRGCLDSQKTSPCGLPMLPLAPPLVHLRSLKKLRKRFVFTLRGGEKKS